MKCLVLTLAALVAVAYSNLDVKAAERAAFAMCDSDRPPNGLTWEEVEACEIKFETAAAAAGLPLPSQEDFEASDLNGDGNLTYAEWLEANGLSDD